MITLQSFNEFLKTFTIQKKRNTTSQSSQGFRIRIGLLETCIVSKVGLVLLSSCAACCVCFLKIMMIIIPFVF